MYLEPCVFTFYNTKYLSETSGVAGGGSLRVIHPPLIFFSEYVICHKNTKYKTMVEKCFKKMACKNVPDYTTIYFVLDLVPSFHCTSD